MTSGRVPCSLETPVFQVHVMSGQHGSQALENSVGALLAMASTSSGQNCPVHILTQRKRHPLEEAGTGEHPKMPLVAPLAPT